MAAIIKNPVTTWKKEHSDQITPFNPCDRVKYLALFRRHVYKENLPKRDQEYLHLCKNVLKVSRSTLSKQLFGSCYGFAMSLLEHQQVTGSPPSLETEESKEEFINQALFYSLYDITRFCYQTNSKVNSHDHLFQKPDERVFMRTHEISKVAFLDIMHVYLRNVDSSFLILKVWSQKQQFPSPKRSRKRVSPHTILMSLQEENRLFYFYDTKLKGYHKCKSAEGMFQDFFHYIRTVRPHYLQSQIVWKFLFWE